MESDFDMLCRLAKSHGVNVPESKDVLDKEPRKYHEFAVIYAILAPYNLDEQLADEKINTIVEYFNKRFTAAKESILDTINPDLIGLNLPDHPKRMKGGQQIKGK